MRPASPRHRWLKPLTTLALLAATAIPAAAAIPNTERLALMALYTSAGGANWTDKTGWGGGAGTECSWYGVTCSAGDANVTEIVLWFNGLSGTLPASLKDLTELENLNVSGNDLSGTLPALPPKLQGLLVSSNRLTGPIPPLPATLLGMEIDSNQLSGPIPALPAGFTTLYADDNLLTGSIPTLPADMLVLAISNNRLTGAIPALPATLDFIDATNNRLSGPIPALPANLTGVYLENNQLTGAIPALPARLSAFYVANNQLTGTPPAAPANLRAGGSSLCPNFLTPPSPTDAAWDAATGGTPWSADCRAAPPVGVPTLGEWALLLLGLAAAGLGARRLRDRQA